MKPSELLSKEEIDRLNRQFASPERPPQEVRVGPRVRALLCPLVDVEFYNIRNPDVDPNMVKFDRSYLELLPRVSEKSTAISLFENRPLQIGRGAGNDVRLEEYGHCNFVSPKHAIIFYERESNKIELLNYSEFGIKVNSVFYSMNVATPMTLQGKLKRAKMLPVPTRGLGKNKVTAPCKCGLKPSTGLLAKTGNPADGSVGLYQPGWEGSVFLTHGCLIKFGCKGFVLSVID